MVTSQEVEDQDDGATRDSQAVRNGNWGLANVTMGGGFNENSTLGSVSGGDDNSLSLEGQIGYLKDVITPLEK